MTDKEKLLNSDFGYVFKILKSEKLTMILLPITGFDVKLQALSIDSNETFRIDYVLTEVEGLIVFHNLFSNQTFGFDISELTQNKISFRAENGKGIVFEVSDIPSSSDLLQHLP